MWCLPKNIGGISRCNCEIVWWRNKEMIGKGALKHGRQGLFDEHVAQSGLYPTMQYAAMR